MGGIQRRRRRMRQHQPVSPPAAAEPETPEEVPEVSRIPEVSAGEPPVTEAGPRTEITAEPVAEITAEPVAESTAEPVAEIVAEPVAAKPVPRPSPHHLAELSGAFAMTANVHDPEPVEAPTSPAPRPAPSGPRDEDDHDDHHHPHEGHHHHHHHQDEVVSERGLRGLVGGGASQVSVSAAMRARDAARPSAEDLAAAERDLPIIRRGWIPREELTRPGRRSPTG